MRSGAALARAVPMGQQLPARKLHRPSETPAVQEPACPARNWCFVNIYTNKVNHCCWWRSKREMQTPTQRWGVPWSRAWVQLPQSQGNKGKKGKTKPKQLKSLCFITILGRSFYWLICNVIFMYGVLYLSYVHRWFSWYDPLCPAQNKPFPELSQPWEAWVHWETSSLAVTTSMGGGFDTSLCSPHGLSPHLCAVLWAQGEEKPAAPCWDSGQRQSTGWPQQVYLWGLQLVCLKPGLSPSPTHAGAPGTGALQDIWDTSAHRDADGTVPRTAAEPHKRIFIPLHPQSRQGFIHNGTIVFWSLVWLGV